jgi:murein DD-endopeptidase MepM/ murein hydrolase activator NlpD
MTIRPSPSDNRLMAREQIRIGLLLRMILVLPIAFLIFACSRHKVSIEKPASAAARPGVYHIVEKHQTLYRICKTYQVDLQAVAAANGITDPGKIREGQRVFIPGAGTPLKVEIYFEDVVAEPAGKAELEPVAKKPNFLWPVRGKCVDFFTESETKRHHGIDIACPLGTAVKASSPGVVIYSGNTIKGYGNLVILRHSEEFVTVYAHHDANLVEEGAKVQRGQTIGRVGKTGRATGPHLHFEIRRNNKAVDPLPWLR